MSGEKKTDLMGNMKIFQRQVASWIRIRNILSTISAGDDGIQAPWSLTVQCTPLLLASMENQYEIKQDLGR